MYFVEHKGFRKEDKVEVFEEYLPRAEYNAGVPEP